MTNEELDNARASEAWRLCNRDGGDYSTAVYHAARLAREGWTPPDPLEQEAETILHEAPTYHTREHMKGAILRGLRRGVEIGRQDERMLNKMQTENDVTVTEITPSASSVSDFAKIR